MAEEEKKQPEECRVEGDDGLGDPDVKIILLGDSAVGKSKLVERYMMDEYHPRQLSTYALTLFRKEATLPDGTPVKVDFWDTAGQERFSNMHPSYYYGASGCILVFDVTRKSTYQNLSNWYSELREYCENIPCVLVANKIDVDYKVTNKKFKFGDTHGLDFSFVSAADGTNVVKVFEDMIAAAVNFKKEGGDFMSDVLDLLGDLLQHMKLFQSQRKVIFRVLITIHECTNIHQKTGKVYIKWKANPPKTNCGVLAKVHVHENTATWNSQFCIEQCQLSVNPKNNIVNDYHLRLSIRQEDPNKASGFDRIGIVLLNLAEFLRVEETTRRFLLTECPVNSTLQISIKTEQVEGDPLFRCPETIETRETTTQLLPNSTYHEPQFQQPTQDLEHLSDSRASVYDTIDEILQTSERNRSKHLPSK